MEILHKKILKFLRREGGYVNQTESVPLFIVVDHMEEFHKENLRDDLIAFFKWYKNSSFGPSGKVEDLIDMYLGKPNITATAADAKPQVFYTKTRWVGSCFICGKGFDLYDSRMVNQHLNQQACSTHFNLFTQNEEKPHSLVGWSYYTDG